MAAWRKELEVLREIARRIKLREYRLVLLLGAGSAAYFYFFLIPFPLVKLAPRWHQTVGTLTRYDRGEMVRFAAGVLVLFVLYVLGLHWIQRVAPLSRAGWRLVILGCLGFSAILLFSYPLFSTDVFDNIMHGRILGHYGANPFVNTAAEFPDDPFFRHVMWYDDPSAYGPLWEVAAAALSLLAGDGLLANILLFKGFSVLAFVVDGVLIVAILRQIAPERALTGVFLYAWNPLILIMNAGDGHNDSLMMVFVLGGILLALRGRWTLAVLAQVGGALTKFIPIVLVPLFLLAGWWESPQPRRWHFLLTAVGLSALLVLTVYAPFLGGEDLLDIGRRQELLTSSAATLLYYSIRRWLGWPVAKRIVSLWAMSGLGFLVLRQMSTLRLNRPLALMRAVTLILLGYLLLFCIWFWPWYLVWVIPLVALLPAGVLQRGVILFCVTAIWRPLIVIYWREWFGLPAYMWRQVGLTSVTMLAPWLYFGYHRIKGDVRDRESAERIALTGE